MQKMKSNTWLKLFAIIMLIVLLMGLGTYIFTNLTPASVHSDDPPSTTTRWQTQTTYYSETITSTPGVGACSEAPLMLSIPINERDDGIDYHMVLVGSMGIYKGTSVGFSHFGTTIESTATVFNHFDVTVVSHTDDVDWGAIDIHISVWGSMEGGDWTEIGSVNEGDIPLAMTDPYTTVFGYDLEMNYYTILNTLGGAVYGDGKTAVMYLDMSVWVGLVSASTGEWLDGGDWIYYGMQVSNFQYCLDASGIYDCNIEYWNWPED